MTDPATGSRLVVVNRPDGSDVNLRKLSPADWVSLGNTLRANRKSALRVDLACGTMTADEQRAKLDAFDRRPVKYADVERFVNTLDGQYAVLRLAAQRHDPSADDDGIDLLIASLAHPSDWTPIVADLCDLRVVEVLEDPPHPPAGVPGPQGTPEQSQTGTQSPGESNASSGATAIP